MTRSPEPHLTLEINPHLRMFEGPPMEPLKFGSKNEFTG